MLFSLNFRRVGAMVAGIIISLFLKIRKQQVGEIRDLGEAFGELRLGRGYSGPLTPNAGSDLKPKAAENATNREKAGVGFSIIKGSRAE